MKVEDIYEHFGKSWTKVSRELKVPHSSLQNWRKRGFIPIRTQMLLERKSNGLFKASLDDAGFHLGE